MRIKSFQASGVHGYLDFDVTFFHDLTFLIGINGSGKTTVVRTIHALLSPSFLYLANTQFQVAAVEVEISNHELPIILSARQDSVGIYIKSNRTDKELFIKNYDVPPNEPDYKIRDLLISYYRDQTAFHSDHPVLELINSIPTPMFLGLERRAQLGGQPNRTFWRSAPSARPIRRNVFGGALAQSLDEASELASVRFRQIQEQEDKLKDKLRNALILRAFEFAEMSFSIESAFPSRPQRIAISAQSQNVMKTLAELGLSSDEIESKVKPFFDRLTDILNDLPLKGDPSELLGKVPTDKQSPILNWVVNKWQFDRLSGLANLVDRFIADSRKLYEPIDRFLETVNGFLSDSGKRIEMDRFGLHARVVQLERRPLTDLSSGEQQLLVLLTHLAFNPAAHTANVLIIDEPELSLHVSWQEMFVDALLKASASIQLILATHSPSIILDRVNKCVELGGLSHG